MSLPTFAASIIPPVIQRLPEHVKPQRLVVQRSTIEEILNPSPFHTSQRIIVLTDTQESDEDGVDRNLPATERLRKIFLHELPHYIKKGTEHAVNLPLTAAPSFRGLLPLLILGHVVGTFLPTVVVMLLPYHDVNQGVGSNRFFLYGTLSFYDLAFITTFVATFDFAMPKASFPIKARIGSVAIGVLFAKILESSIAEGWMFGEGGLSLFPIPFAVCLTIPAALPATFASLFWMSPKRSEKAMRKKCWHTVRLMVGLIVSLGIALLWMTFFRILEGTLLQKVWGLVFYVLKLLCKTFLIGQIALKLNLENLIPLQFMVEMAFTFLQAEAMSYVTLASFLCSLISGPLVLALRLYAANDRLAILFCFASKKMIRKAKGDNTTDEAVQQHCGSNDVFQVASGLIKMSHAQVHRLCLAQDQQAKARASRSQLHADWSETITEPSEGHCRNGAELTVEDEEHHQNNADDDDIDDANLMETGQSPARTEGASIVLVAEDLADVPDDITNTSMAACVVTSTSTGEGEEVLSGVCEGTATPADLPPKYISEGYHNEI
jgi:trehalose-6-phosphatase